MKNMFKKIISLNIIFISFFLIAFLNCPSVKASEADEEVVTWNIWEEMKANDAQGENIHIRFSTENKSIIKISENSKTNYISSAASVADATSNTWYFLRNYIESLSFSIIPSQNSYKMSKKLKSLIASYYNPANPSSGSFVYYSKECCITDAYIYLTNTTDVSSTTKIERKYQIYDSTFAIPNEDIELFRGNIYAYVQFKFYAKDSKTTNNTWSDPSGGGSGTDYSYSYSDYTALYQINPKIFNMSNLCRPIVANMLSNGSYNEYSQEIYSKDSSFSFDAIPHLIAPAFWTNISDEQQPKIIIDDINVNNDDYSYYQRIEMSNNNKDAVAHSNNAIIPIKKGEKNVIARLQPYEKILIHLVDNYNNIREYYLYFDNTPPVGILSTSQSGGFPTIEGNTTYYTKGNVTVNCEDITFSSATLDGNPYILGSVIETEGKHTLKIYDGANNSIEYKIIIDKTAPSVTSTIESGSVAINSGFSYPITYSDDYFKTATLNGINYVSGASITEDGVYNFKVIDKANNIVEISFAINTTNPVGILSTTQSGDFRTNNLTNGNVTFTWSESGCSATLDGIAYTKEDSITGEGTHTIILTDLIDYLENYRKTTTYTFTIDKTAPVGILSTSQSGGFRANNLTNGNVTFTWSESGCIATLDGVAYTKGVSITEEGSHTFLLTDLAGNVQTYSFVIDKTVTGILTGVNTNNYANSNVTFTWSESGCTATLDGEAYEKEDPITEEGTHDIILTDLAGNSTTYTFTIDKNKIIIIASVEDGGITKEDVKVINIIESISGLETNSLLYTINGENRGFYEKGTEFKESGSYQLFVKSNSGNTTTYVFTIDKTAPTGILTGVENGGITNSNVVLSWSESGCSATLDGLTYEKEDSITGEGTHDIILTDEAGNNTTYTFTIDRTAPVGILSTTQSGDFRANNLTNGNVTFSWNESGCSATLDGIAYTKGRIVSEEGNYSIVLTDNVGNSTTYTFTIDKTAPVGILSTTQSGGFRANNLTNNNVTFTWSESGCSATLDGVAYTKGTTTKTDGTHDIILTDLAGNSTTYVFTIDKTAPVGILSTTQSGGFRANNLTNAEVRFTWSESGCSTTLDGIAYTKGTVVSEEGNYSIILTDNVGNSTTYTFTIDKTAPVGILSTTQSGGFRANNLTNNNVTFTWSESGCNATLDGIAYTKGTNISKEGTHQIILTDEAGNNTGYSFTIDKTNPTFMLYESINSLDYEERTSFNYPLGVYFTWEEEGCTATLNNEAYEKGTTIKDEGSYVFKLQDILSNTVTYSFDLDFTPYNKNYDYFINNLNSTLNHWWKSYDYKFNEIDNKYEKNNDYSFVSYQMAEQFALGRETSVCEYGSDYVLGSQIWSSIYKQYVSVYDIENMDNGLSYTIYKSPSSATTMVAYFSQTYLFDTIKQYAKASITEQVIPSNIPAPFPGNEEVEKQKISLQYIYTKGVIQFIYKPSNVLLYIKSAFTYNDFSLFNYYTELTEEGSYEIREIDEAGNIIEYCLIIDKTAPRLQISGIENSATLTNDINNNTSINVTAPLNIAAIDDYDSAAVLKITNPNGTITYKFKGEAINLNASGTYTITAIDSARNVLSEKKISISYESPSILFEDVINAEEKPEAFNLTINTNNSLNKINSITISKWDSTNDIWQRLEKDDKNIVIAASIKTYYFSQNGKYKVLIFDNFGRIIEGTHELERDKPVGLLKTLSGDILNAGFIQFNADGTIGTKAPTITGQSVYLTWSDTDSNRYTATVIYYNNQTTNEIYYKENPLRNDGFYVIRLKNNIDLYSDFVFTIDKTAPLAYAYDAEDNLIAASKTNKDFYFTWEEEGCKGFYTTKDSSVEIPYFRNTLLNLENTYSLKLVDEAGNYNIFIKTIDKTAPVVTIYSGTRVVPNNSFNNKNIKFTWSESGCTATLNGEEYISGTVLDIDQKYILKIYDSIGNVATYSTTKNSVPITIKIYDLQNNLIEEKDIYKNAIKIVSSKAATITLDGNEYNEEYIVENGTHIYIANDKYGNSYKFTFSIDTLPPEGILTTTQEDGFRANNLTNAEVRFTWSESGCSATLDGIAYTKDKAITKEGIHQIFLSDKAGNTTTYVFTIDRTAPTGILTGVNTNNYANSNVTFTWSESGCTATLDGYLYISNMTISEEGSHQILLTDEAGNVQSYNFVIDTIAPEGELSTTQEDGFQENNYTNGNVRFTWSESGCTATLDGEKYYKNTEITKSKYYEIILIDLAGNSTTYVFTIDKTIPTGILTGVEDGGITNNNVSFSWDESMGFVALIDGLTYTNGNIISEEGIHEIKIISVSKNYKIYTFTIDKTAPTGELSTTQEDGFQENNYTNGNVRFTWSESGCTATLDEVIYSKESLIRDEGTHTIVLTDKAGNTSQPYTFTIDKTAPELVVKGVTNNGTTQNKVYLTILENKHILSITKVSSGEEETSNNIYFKEFDYEDTFIISLKDISLNTTTYVFTIDRTAPTGILTGVEDKGITNNNVSFTWRESGCIATLDGIAYTKDSTIRNEGIYEIILSDLVGNSTTYTFTIDKTIPAGILTGVNTNNYANSNVTFTWSESGCTATLDGEAYEKEDPITEEGSHTAFLTDLAGNSTTYTFTIDKTFPIINSILNGGYYKTTQTVIAFDNNKINSISYTLNNGESINISNGSTIIKEGLYKLCIEDIANNRINLEFTIDKTAPVGTLVGVENNKITNCSVMFVWQELKAKATLNGVEYLSGTTIEENGIYTIILTDQADNSTAYSFEIDKTAPTGILTGVEDKGITYTTVSFTWSESGCSATLDENIYYKGTNISKEGTHQILLSDKAGNTTTYVFTIDKTLPAGTLIGVAADGYTNGNVSFSWDESKNYIVYLNEEKYNNNSIITKEQKHFIKIIGENGLEFTYVFTIDRTAPTGILTGVEDGGITNSNVLFSWEEAICIATLNDEKYLSGTTIEENGIYTIILTDQADNFKEYSFEIDKKAPLYNVYATLNPNNYTRISACFVWEEEGCIATLDGKSYASGEVIETEGKHSFIICDSLGNKATFTFYQDFTAPTGTLIGVEDGEITNNNVSFSWDEENCTVLLDDEKYFKNGTITKNGFHEIKILDSLGNTRTYTFTIDKVNPTGELSTTQNGGFKEVNLTNGDVSLIWNENDCSATLNNEIYASGEVIETEGEHTIILTDEAGNTTTYTFTIDKTIPAGILTGVEVNETTATNVTFTWEERGCFAALDGEVYTKDSTIRNEGIHEIILSDKAGNTKVYNFVINKVYPNAKFTNSITNEEIELEVNSCINYDLKISFENCTAILDEINVESGFTLSEEKEYILTLTSAINELVTTYVFTIDKTAPTLVLDGVENGGITNKTVVITWDKTSAYQIFVNNEKEYNSGSLTISKNGTHEVKIEDKAGNFTIYSFERFRKDITKDDIKTFIPTIVENETTYSPVNFKNSYTTEVRFEIAAEYSAKLKYKLEEQEEIIDYENNTIITDNNKYTLVLNDKYGNIAEFDFRIDIDHSVYTPDNTKENVVIILIILMPIAAVITFVFARIKYKGSNPFRNKKKGLKTK